MHVHFYYAEVIVLCELSHYININYHLKLATTLYHHYCTVKDKYVHTLFNYNRGLIVKYLSTPEKTFE